MLINFDYDGVIVDSFEILYQQTLAAQALIGVGRPPTRHDLHTLENMTFEELGRQCNIPLEHIPPFVGHVFDFQRQATTLPPLFPGIAERLKDLSRHHTLTIITSSFRAAVERTLHHYDLSSTISLILDGASSESKGERIVRSQQIYGFSAGETYMVGDAMSDIRQGKLAGVHTIAVSWGFQPRQILVGECPDFILDHPDALQLSLFRGSA